MLEARAGVCAIISKIEDEQSEYSGDQGVREFVVLAM